MKRHNIIFFSSENVFDCWDREGIDIYHSSGSPFSRSGSGSGLTGIKLSDLDFELI